MGVNLLVIIYIIFSLIPIVAIGIMLGYSTLDKALWGWWAGILVFAIFGAAHQIISKESSSLFLVIIGIQFLASLAFLIVYAIHQKQEDEPLFESITISTYAFHISWYVIFIPFILGILSHYRRSAAPKCPEADKLNKECKNKIESVTNDFKTKLADCKETHALTDELLDISMNNQKS